MAIYIDHGILYKANTNQISLMLLGLDELILPTQQSYQILPTHANDLFGETNLTSCA